MAETLTIIQNNLQKTKDHGWQFRSQIRKDRCPPELLVAGIHSQLNCQSYSYVCSTTEGKTKIGKNLTDHWIESMLTNVSVALKIIQKKNL